MTTTADSSDTLSEKDLNWMLYFLGPTTSAYFEHSIRERWNITEELFKAFDKWGFNFGYDDEIEDDDIIHQQFKKFKQKAVAHNYLPYVSGSFIEALDIETPFHERKRRCYQYEDNENNNHQSLTTIVEQGMSEMGEKNDIVDKKGDLPSDFDLLIVDRNKWVDTSPDHSRTECQYEVNEQNGSHIGYVQIVEKQSGRPLEHPNDQKEILLGALLFALNTYGEELVAVPNFDLDMIQHGPAITMKCQTRAVADNDNTIMTREIDLVYALPCSDWPCQAQNFKYRQMTKPSWPNRKKFFRHKDDRRQLYCCLVPIAHRNSSSPAFEWRYSFSILEALLNEQLLKRNEFLLVIYRIFKYLYKYGQTKDHQTGLDMISHNRGNSYYLKTLFFWSCEQDVQNGRYFPDWSIKTVWKKIKDLFQKLKTSLENKQLWNFFIDTNNMVDHLSNEDIQPILNFIDQVLIDPVQCLLQTFSVPMNGETTTTLILDRSKAVISLPIWSHLLEIKLCPIIQIKHVLYQRKIDLMKYLEYYGSQKFKRREKHLRKYFHNSLMIRLQPYRDEHEDFLQRICDVISFHSSSNGETEMKM